MIIWYSICVDAHVTITVYFPDIWHIAATFLLWQYCCYCRISLLDKAPLNDRPPSAANQQISSST